MDTQKSTVLIVDDQLLGRQLLESILYKEGYNLIFAEDGEEAYNKAQESLPDIILLDIMMPKMDGYETTRTIRKNEALKDVPVLLITALDDRDSRIKGFEAGADDYIIKPIDRVEVLTRVRTITRLNRYRRIYEKDSDPGNELVSEVHAEQNSKAPAINASMFKTLFHDIINKEEKSYYLFSDNSRINNVSFLYKNNHKEIIFLWNIGGDKNLSEILSINAYVSSKIKSVVLEELSKEEMSIDTVLKNLISSTQTNCSDKLPILKEHIIEFVLCIIDKKENSISYGGTNTTLLLNDDTQVTELSCNNNFSITDEISNINFNSSTKSLTGAKALFVTLNTSFESIEKSQLSSLISIIHSVDDLNKINFNELQQNKGEPNYLKLLAINI